MTKPQKVNIPALFERIGKKCVGTLGNAHEPRIFVKDYALSTGARRVFMTAQNMHCSVEVKLIYLQYRIPKPQFHDLDPDVGNIYGFDAVFAKRVLGADRLTCARSDPDERGYRKDEISTDGKDKGKVLCNQFEITWDDIAFARAVRTLRFRDFKPDWKFLFKACTIRDERDWTKMLSVQKVQGKMSIVATDNNRIHYQHVNLSDEWDGVTIPQEIISYIKQYDSQVALWNPGCKEDETNPTRYIIFRLAPDLYMVSPVASKEDVHYPDVAKVFPGKETEHQISSESILKCFPKNKVPLIKLARYDSNDRGVVFNGSEMKVTIHDAGGEHILGKFRTWLPRPVTNGSPIKINGDYLTDLLLSAPGTVEFYEAVDGKTPLLAFHSHPGSQDNYHGIIASMKPQECDEYGK